jgi:hypothetical protein
MLNTRSSVAALCMVLLGGCASMPAEMVLDPKVHPPQGGVVVGALINGGPYGTWLEFRDTRTGKSFGWGPKDYYSAWLPAGEYEVQGLGSRQGLMGAYSQPLRFTVKDGAINYLGEMAYDCPPSARPAALYGVQDCGFLAMFSCSVPRASAGICVVDRQDQALKNFLARFPRYAGMPIHTSLMSMRQPPALDMGLLPADAQ